MNDKSDSAPGGLHEQIRKAHGKFAAMASTYFVGVFNDNFFKQSALIIAVESGRSEMQGYATLIFTLPFILFAAPAGWCADRFPKRAVVITAKLLEMTAMIFGALGVYYVNWTLILLMLGIEGLQATMFSPALNGSLPELYPAKHLMKANAVLKMISTGAILAGIATAGFVLDAKGSLAGMPLNRLLVVAVVISISAVGVFMSLAVPKFPAASPNAPFPWHGPIHTIRTLYEIRHDLLLTVTIISNTFFWLIASLGVLVVNQLGLTEFGLSASTTSSLVVAELLGIAIGGLISTYLATGRKWYRALALSCFIMAVCMLSVSILPYAADPMRTIYLTLILFITGAAAGVFVIPLESFLQVRPPAHCKGATIAAANFTAFAGILFSGPIANLFNWLKITPSRSFAVMGTAAMAMTIWLVFILRRKRIND